MDRSTHITLGGVAVGLVCGYGAGWLAAVLRRAWRDVASAKGIVATRRRGAWVAVRETLVLGVLLAVVVAFALGHG